MIYWSKEYLDKLLGKGENVTYEQVLEDMRWRDENDKTRKIAPAVPAADAVMLDNGSLDIQATLDAASQIIESKVKI